MGYEEGRRAPRTPQLYHREPSFRYVIKFYFYFYFYFKCFNHHSNTQTKFYRKIQSSSALPGLPYWVRRQGWVGAVVGAFLFGIIICLVFTMGTVVKPETAMMPVVQRRPLPTQDLETSLSERLRKLEEEKARVAEAAKYDKAEADRLRNIIERDHDKDSPQQLALQKRIGRLEQVIRSQEQRDTVPKTSDQPTTPIPTKLHQTIRFEDGVTVIAKADVRVGNSDQIIVQKGSLGIVLKSNSDFKTKVQFMGAYGTKNPVVIFVKSEVSLIFYISFLLLKQLRVFSFKKNNNNNKKTNRNYSVRL